MRDYISLLTIGAIGTGLNSSTTSYGYESRIDQLPSSLAFSTVSSRTNAHIRVIISEVEKLRANWDFDGAIEPSNKAIQLAKRLIEDLDEYGHAAYHAAPGPNGEIMVSFRGQTGNEMEIIFYDDRKLFVKLPKNAKPSQGVFKWSELRMHLDWLEGYA